MAKLSWKESEFHTKRIEMANRNLMIAARTLAKVKKSKLPDVLALVNVNPPTAGPAWYIIRLGRTGGEAWLS